MGPRIVAIVGIVAGVAVAGALTACTSDHGALPPPSASPTSDPTSEPTQAGRAETALLGPDDVPDGFSEADDGDIAGRWDELLNESEQSVSVRPDCSAPLEAVSSRLAETPADSAGIVFVDDDDGGEILQFTAVLDEALGTTIVTELDDLHARCDGYTLPVPESGSLSISIHPLDLEVDANDEATVTVWERTLISSTLRQREIRAAYSAGDISGFISIAGEPDLSDDAVAELISNAVQNAEEAGR